jgi:short-subunit dehydrogenase
VVTERWICTNRRIIDLNLTSTITSCRTFTPQFKLQGYGKIINVSSACDRRSWQGWSVYSAAKAGVNAFTKCLYTELRPHGIAVTLLVPGGSNTGFQAAAEGVKLFEWDESLAVRPEHFADMVYQTCALSKGGCVSELLVYGLAQDVSGFDIRNILESCESSFSNTVASRIWLLKKHHSSARR